MRPRHIPIHRQIPVQKRQQLRAARRVPPIAHQVHDDGEEALQDHACVFHAAVRVRGEAAGECPARFGVGDDGVAFGAEGEGEEFGAWYDEFWGVDGRGRKGREGVVSYVQTSVVMPASMIWLLFCATTAALKSALSHASTSPLRFISGALGYRSRISFGRGPLGPVWALVVRTMGMLKAFAMEECAMMLLRKTVGS